MGATFDSDALGRGEQVIHWKEFRKCTVPSKERVVGGSPIMDPGQPQPLDLIFLFFFGKGVFERRGSQIARHLRPSFPRLCFICPL